MTIKNDLTRQKLKALRIKAENRLASNEANNLAGILLDAKALIHELHVHQIELEMQNEELRQTQTALEASRAHYIELYDNAPVGYLTLSEDGIILEINFTAAKLLDKVPIDIVKTRFASFINDDYKDIWYRHFQRAKHNGEQQGCELPFGKGPESISYYHLNFQRLHSADSSILIRVTFTDVTARKKHEEALSIAAAAFETQDCIIITDVENKVLRVNQAFCQVTGYSAEEAAQLVFPPQQVNNPKNNQEIFSAIADRGYWRGELLWSRKNGAPLLMAINITAVTSKLGNLTHYVADFIDMTEHRQLENKLYELSRDFNAFLENTSDYVYFKDRDNRFRFCSNSLARIVGKEKWGDLVGKDLFDMFPEDNAKQYFEKELSILKEGKALLSYLEPYYNKEGHQGWVSTSKWPQFDEKGEISGIFGISRDVTEQHKVEQKLRWSEELNCKILEAIPAHIAVIDASGTIITVNKAWTDFALENSPANVDELGIGANYLDICRQSSALHDTDAARALAGIKAILNGSTPQFTMEYPCNSPQEPRWFFMFVVQLVQSGVAGAVVAHQNITERKLAELKQAESEQRWRFALQAANLGSCEINLATSRVWISPRHGQIFGYQEPLPEWSYDIFLQHVTEEAREKVSRTIQEGIAAHQPYSFECPIRRVDGETRWICVHSKYSKARPELLFGVIEDITERKQTEILLRNSEARYRHLLENQTEMICRFKLDGTILFVNEAYCRFFGITKSQIEGQQWQPLVWPEDLQMVSDKVNSLSPKKPVVTIENRVTAAKGKLRWGQWVNRGFFDNQGELVEIQTVGRDITERKQYDALLRVAAAAFEAQESIMVTDSHKVIQRVNKAFTRISGYSSKEALGRTPRILSSGLHDKLYYDHIMDTVKNQGYWHGEIWNKRKNGEIYPVLQTITAVTDESGMLTHYVGSMVDITVQKQAEKVLLDARSSLEQQVATTQEEIVECKSETAEINSTLNVLLKNRNSDQKGAQTELMSQFEFTISPLLNNLKGASKGRHQSLRLLKILEASIQQMVEGYGQAANLTTSLKILTPIERRIADMVRQGQPTKVIAAALNVVPGTVSVHRKNIRKKLNLIGKTDNLQLYLESLIE